MPLKQGDLDSLCGVYAVVNSFNIIYNLSKQEREQLFKHLILTLENQQLTADAIVSGTYKWHIDLLLKSACSYMNNQYAAQVSIEYLFKTNARVGIQTFWKKIANFVEKDEKNLAIITMTGKYDHWACVRKVTKNTMILEDSVGISHIRKSRCRMEKYYHKDYYNLTPTQTWGLHIKDYK